MIGAVLNTYHQSSDEKLAWWQRYYSRRLFGGFSCCVAVRWRPLQQTTLVPFSRFYLSSTVFYSLSTWPSYNVHVLWETFWLTKSLLESSLPSLRVPSLCLSIAYILSLPFSLLSSFLLFASFSHRATFQSARLPFPVYIHKLITTQFKSLLSQSSCAISFVFSPTWSALLLRDWSVLSAYLTFPVYLT